MRTLGGIAPWFGSKRTMAPDIVRELGPHRAYWEPFCGSMAVLFAKEPSQQETVCDLHGELINLARVLASEDAYSLYEKSARILASTELYCEYRDADPPKEPLDRALRYLCMSWLGRNGISGTKRYNYSPSVRFTTGGGSTATRWRSAVESIPAWHERLRNVLILQRDAFAVLAELPDQNDIAIYIDPPYVNASRARGSQYEHDFTEEQHAELARILGRFRRARVVVSYYDCNDVRGLYDGWTFLCHARQKNLHVQNKRGMGRCEAPEVLIINGPSFTKPDQQSLFGEVTDV